MKKSKEELIALIEEARKTLNSSIDTRADYDIVYQHSIELDQLIVQYMASGY